MEKTHPWREKITPQLSNVHRLVRLLSHHLWFPVVSQESGSCQGRAKVFQRVILHGEEGQGCIPTQERLALFGCGSRE
jgi:hypothetical protein